MEKPYYYLRKVPKTDGTHAIMIHVYTTEGRLRRSVSKILGHTVQSDEWDDGKQQLKGRGEETRKLNDWLAGRLAKATQILIEYDLAGIGLDHDTFWKEWNNHASRGDFITYFEEESKREYERGLISEPTYITEKRTLRKIREWKPVIMYGVINRKLIEDFDRWHARQLEKDGHVGLRERERCLKHLYKYMRRAEGDNIKFQWPFGNFKWPKPKSNIEFLTEEELRLLMALYEDEQRIIEGLVKMARRKGLDDHHIDQASGIQSVERIKTTIRRFVFQCLTGYRVSDLLSLRWQDHVRGNHIIIEPKKTDSTSGKIVFMRLSDLAKRWAWKPNEANGYLVKKTTDQKYNKALKEVQDILGWDLRLRTHLARHTFATLYLARGGKLEILMQLLGVTSMKTVMVYVHVTQNMADKSMEEVWDNW